MASQASGPALYRAKAEECMRLAQQATTPAQRAQYLDLAAHWHALATSADWQTTEPPKQARRRAATE